MELVAIVLPLTISAFGFVLKDSHYDLDSHDTIERTILSFVSWFLLGYSIVICIYFFGAEIGLPIWLGLLTAIVICVAFLNGTGFFKSKISSNTHKKRI